MPNPSIFYEMEYKALLSKEQYTQLLNRLFAEKKLINADVIYTLKFKPDLRLRHSPKIAEIVCKEGDPTKLCRKEISIPLRNKNEIEYFNQLFQLMGLEHDPPWIKHKHEFLYSYKGYDYIACVQHIENFAYILEVEFCSMTRHIGAHKDNIRAIIRELGCEPITPKEYTQKIEEYIKQNKPR
ncbi:MAG: hypothetical protein ABIG95_02365 [Candidatus Woesearchaeota archaeon]